MGDAFSVPFILSCSELIRARGIIVNYSPFPFRIKPLPRKLYLMHYHNSMLCSASWCDQKKSIFLFGLLLIMLIDMQVTGSKQLHVMIHNYRGDCLTSDFYLSNQDWQHSALQRLHTKTSLYEWSENKWIQISLLKDLILSLLTDRYKTQVTDQKSHVSLEPCIGN